MLNPFVDLRKYLVLAVRSYRTALIVRSADKKWAALWYCHQYELLSNSAKQLELKLVPAERRAVQVTYEAQPQAGATVFVYDEFNAEPMTTDKDGIVCRANLSWGPTWDSGLKLELGLSA